MSFRFSQNNSFGRVIAGVFLFPAWLWASPAISGLVAYYPFTSGSLANESGSSVPAIENKGASFGTDRFGNENSAAMFNGNADCYMEIPDDDAFSIATTGSLTISVWVSPASLNFENAESGGYVHWMGKGVPQQHEWVFRMYNKDLTGSQENRPNRMSAYAFNLQGGLGSGSYVQELLVAGEWIHFVVRYDIESNTITLFKNGMQKDQDPLYDETYGVQVENGTAPVRLGTRSLWSFFKGRIDDLRFYNRALNDDEILALYSETDPALDLSSSSIASSSASVESSGSTEFSSSSSVEAVNSSNSEKSDVIFNRGNPPRNFNGFGHHGNLNPRHSYQIQFMMGDKSIDAAGRRSR